MVFQRRRLQGGLLALAMVLLPLARATTSQLDVSLHGARFDISNEAGLRALKDAAAGALTNSTTAGKTRRGLEVIRAAAAEALTNIAARPRLQTVLAETGAALQNNDRPPVPARVDLFQVPFVHRRYAGASIGRGSFPAVNLDPRSGQANDFSSRDPLPSTFWTRPTNIAAHDLRIGFDREARPAYEERIWNYAGPKTSYGANAGFEAKHGEDRLKVKFGELHSEPFAARIFHALGYHVDPTDYSPGLKVKMDERLFAEFNSRKPVDTRITALGFLPVWTIHFQPRHDPFRFIVGAVLHDGTHVHGDFVKRLCTGSNAASRVAYLITGPANVQLEQRRARSIGPWDFGQLGHEHLRELRGAGILAAWLGWFDSRFDNTRLKRVGGSGSTELKHYFSDLGGGLGKSQGWTGWRGEDINAFAPHFTEPERRRGTGRMTTPFRIVNFRPVESTPAFAEMTIDDARWMARWIAQLSNDQIRDALAASGFDDRTAGRYAARLIGRRDRMLRDLEMARETPAR